MEGMVMRQRLKDFYSGKKVFLTGHTGFKGAWMTALLKELGADVKGYSLVHQTDKDLFPILFSSPDFNSIIDDIRNAASLSKEIISFQPDYIFHLAAQPLVRKSYKIPSETFEVNVVGTANLLEAATKLEKPCQVVIITTDKVYENKETNVHYNENDVLGGYDPYSASKACTELVVSSFRNSFFNTGRYEIHQKSIASARAGNVIGGGDQNEDRLVPDIVNALMINKAIDVRSPSSIRPWQHVLEPLTGYLLLGTYMKENPVKYATAFNFGPLPDDHMTVKELVEAAIEIWGNGSWNNLSDPNAPHEAGILQLSIEKAMSQLQWTPKLDAKQAVEWTINWYKQEARDKIDYTYHQINQYLSL